MHSDSYDNVLRQRGFRRIGVLDYGMSVSIWWQAQTDARIQILVIRMGDAAILRGSKSYYLRSITQDGETWTRDIPMLHDYLQTHFPEMHLAFSHWRDVPKELADAAAIQRLALEAPATEIPTQHQLDRLAAELQQAARSSRADEALFAMAERSSDLLGEYLRRSAASQRAQVGELRDGLDQLKRRHQMVQQLQREYRRKGSAAVLTFSIGSNIQFARDATQFERALRSVVDELVDYHRFQVRQKLQGGRLNVQVAEAEEPVWCWIEQWLGGALSPTQLQRVEAPELDLLRETAARRVMVTVDQPIEVDGNTRHVEKKLAARVVSSLLARLDRTDPQPDPIGIHANSTLLCVGRSCTRSGEPGDEDAHLSLAQMLHTMVGGTSGAGKSFAARVMVEEAANHPELGVLLLDPRNQGAGLLVPEDRQHVLQHYTRFGMRTEEARGYAFRYHAPALPGSFPLPSELAALAREHSVVSLKGLDDAARCELSAKILGEVFEALAATGECSHPRLLVVIEEAHLFTQRRVSQPAKAAAARAEGAIERIAREGRKFGVLLICVSQSMRDFSHQLATFRQLISTRIFFRNSDNELDYAADVLPDARELAQLPNGVALAHNANWGVRRICFRPPRSKVFEWPDEQLQQFLRAERGPHDRLSVPAIQLLRHLRQAAAAARGPLNLTQLASAAGISSRRRLHGLVKELELTGTVRTRTLPERGKPRVVELMEPDSC
jgi:hypothetical protein